MGEVSAKMLGEFADRLEADVLSQRAGDDSETPSSEILAPPEKAEDNGSKPSAVRTIQSAPAEPVDLLGGRRAISGEAHTSASRRARLGPPRMEATPPSQGDVSLKSGRFSVAAASQVETRVRSYTSGALPFTSGGGNEWIPGWTWSRSWAC